MKKFILLLCILTMLFPVSASSGSLGVATSGVSINKVYSSGTVTLANMRLSTVDGTAHVDFSAAGVLTPYLNHYLTITDSAGKQITVFIKAAGVEQTLSETELVGNGEMETGDPPTGWNATSSTLDGVADERSGGGGAQSLDILGSAAYGQAKRNFASAVVPYGLYKLSLWHKNISGGHGAFQVGFPETTPAYFAGYTDGLNDVAWAEKIKYITAVSYSSGMVILYSSRATYTAGDESRFDSVSFKQVTAPSVTGVTIVSTQGGTTYNWTSQESGFNYNDA